MEELRNKLGKGRMYKYSIVVPLEAVAVMGLRNAIAKKQYWNWMGFNLDEAVLRYVTLS